MTKCRLFPALLLMTVLFLSALLLPAAFRASAADADVVSAFEQQNVMDDLDGMTIDGKAFSVKDYAFDESKPTQVLMLAEFCYSFYSDRQDDFGLYLYVWNPQGLRFDTDDERNLVQLSFDGTTFGHTPFVIAVEQPVSPQTVFVAAHTQDADYRPLSTYVYQSLRCLRITGVVRP